MSYLTLTELVKYYDPRLIAQTSCDDGSETQNDTNVQAALDYSDRLINAAFNHIYTVIQIAASSTVKDIAASLAWSFLLRRKKDPLWKEEYQESMDRLNRLREGVEQLDLTSRVLPSITPDHSAPRAIMSSSSFFDGIPDDTDPSFDDYTP